MHLEKYSLSVKPELGHYEFYSEGPKGSIKKVVVYSPMQDVGENVFNLGFGDWHEGKQGIDDLIVTDNGDREKVLSTVAATILHFVNLRPGSIIFITGSTQSRTRLYQIAINTFYKEITIDFKIYGYLADEWDVFTKGKKYTAFLVVPK